MYLLEGFEEDPAKIWSSNIFGKSLHELVGEGLHNKLSKMPMDARLKLQETLQRNNGTMEDVPAVPMNEGDANVAPITPNQMASDSISY